MDLSSLASILAGIILPIVLVVTAGFVLARTLGIDARPLLRLMLYTSLIAFPLAAIMELRGVGRAVSIIEASMPTAVMASIVAVEFDTRPTLVTGIVFVSTVLNVVTLTVLLGILR